MIEEGSTATDYEPYENICPISGWDGITLTACGKNIYGGWQIANLTKPNGYSDNEVYEDENGRYIKLASSTKDIYYDFPQGLFKENTRYTFVNRFYVSNSVACFRVRYTDGTDTWISPPKGVSTVVTVTPANKTIKSINVINRTATRNLYFEDSGIFEGVLTAADFEPYQPVGRIPNDYQEVEYLESTGTQRIITEFCPNNGKYVFKLKIVPTDIPTDSTYFRVFGNLKGSYDNIYRFQTRINGSQYRFCPCFGTRAQAEQTVDQTYYLRNNIGYEIIIDGVYQQYSVGDYFSKFSLAPGNANDTPIAIFAASPTIGLASAFKLYYFEVEDRNSQRMLNLVPCYRKSDSKPGMYDTVSGKFYTNAGTGEFLVGNDVNSITIDFPKTIYGGYVDLLNGEIVETWNKTIIGTGWNLHDYNIFSKNINGRKSTIVNESSDIICDSYATYITTPISQLQKIPDSRICGRSTYPIVFIRDTNYNTVEEFVNNMSNAEFCYKLLTPVAYPLTPQTIQTLRGANTVWSTSNGDTEVTYWKHGDDAYQYVPAETIASNDNFIVVTDDGYAIGNEQDFITY